MDKIISKPSPAVINLLIICFLLNILFFPMLIYFIASIELTLEFVRTSEFKIKQFVLAFFAGGATLLWVYCIFFYYKFDKYFKGGLGLILFPGLISPFYFFKRILKQKRN